MEMKSKTDGPGPMFGIQNGSDATPTGIDSVRLGSIRFRLRTSMGEAAAELPLAGGHNLMSALAASAVAMALKVKPELIADALRTAKPQRSRGQVLSFADGVMVVDDSSDSNPRSLVDMVRRLTEVSENVRRRVVIAGEMMELGADALFLHREAGREMARLGIDVLWGVRGLAKEIIAGAEAEGISSTRFFESAREAATAALDEAREGDLILVTGSRSVEMDKVVLALTERFSLVGQ